MEKIILDTDLGSDCDDAGAIGILNAQITRGICEGLAITYCLSCNYGPASIDAINRFYGHGDITVGTLKMNGKDANVEDSFINYVGKEFKNSYPSAKDCEDAMMVLRKTLSNAEDNSITVVLIGTMLNMRILFQSPGDSISPFTGEELFNRKVKKVCIMGGDFRANADSRPPEFNIKSDVESAKYFLDRCTVPQYFIPFEVGEKVLSGKSLFEKNNPKNPILRCYDLYCGGQRMSWDLCTVCFASEPDSGLWKISNPGNVQIDEAGHTFFESNTNGSVRIVSSAVDDIILSNEIEKLLSEEYTEQ